MVQEVNYYAYGAVMEGIGVTGDRASDRWSFLYLGKEFLDFNGANLYDFNTRSYDAYIGRFWQLDGANQFASGYTGIGNMPTVGVDPDGQFAFVPILFAAIAGGIFNGASYDMQGKGFLNGFWRGAVTGAVGGTAGIFAPIGILPGLGYGAATGAATGALGAGLNGGNIGRGALFGGISGGVFGGVSGGIGAYQSGANIWSGIKIDETAFSLPTSITDAVPATDEYLDNFSQNNFGSDYKSKLGIKTLSTEKIPLPEGFSMNDGLLFNPEGTPIGGFTEYTPFKRSNIFISPKVFSYGKYSVFGTVGHEFVHAYHNSIGLLLNYPKMDNSYSEYTAYKWSAQVAKNYSQNNQYTFYSQQAAGFLKKAGSVPAAYNIPNWFPYKYK